MPIAPARDRLIVFRDLLDSRLLPYLTEAQDCQLVDLNSTLHDSSEPNNTKRGGAKIGEAKRGDAKIGGDAEVGQVKGGDAKIGQAKRGDAKIGEAKRGDAKIGEAKRGDAKIGEAKRCEEEKEEEGEDDSAWASEFYKELMKGRRNGLSPRHNLRKIAAWLVTEVDDDDAQFLPSVYYDVHLVKEGHMNGFLVMATNVESAASARNSSEKSSLQQAGSGVGARKMPLILFKMHAQRCVIPLNDADALARNPPLQRQARAHSKRMTWTVDKNFKLCMEKCHEYHGSQSWLNAVIRAIWWDWHVFCSEEAPRIHSVEVWDQKGNLVAGEIGVAIYRVYTSLTGFSFKSGTGHLQLRCVKKLLVDLGYKMWDFGMSMPYKLQYGATIMDRPTFYSRFSYFCDRDPLDVPFALDGPKLISDYLGSATT